MNNNNMVSFPQAFIMFWTKYFDFKTRSSRAEFWWAMLGYAIISIVMKFLLPLSDVLALVTAIPMSALATRRMRDINMDKSAMAVGILHLVSSLAIVLLSLAKKVILGHGLGLIITLLVVLFAVYLVTGLIILVVSFIPSARAHRASESQIIKYN